MTRSILITGASTGIGAATARAAAAAGWKVGLFARSAEKLAALAGEIGAGAMPLPGDVTSPADLEGAVAAMAEAHGGLDAVFANAGLGASAAGTEAGDLANLREMIEVNVWGVVATVKAALPELRKRRGHVLITGSNAGERFMPGSVYGATKWFVRGYGGNLADEMGKWGGRCTVLAPGAVDTPFFDDPKPDAITPDEIAAAAMFALNQPPGVDVRKIHMVPSPLGRG